MATGMAAYSVGFFFVWILFMIGGIVGWIFFLVAIWRMMRAQEQMVTMFDKVGTGLERLAESQIQR